MKYLLFFLLTTFGLMSTITYAGVSNCAIDISNNSNPNAVQFLNDCKSTGSISSEDNGISSIQKKIVQIAQRAISLGALFAVGALVWSGIQYNSAFGEDERVKHAKNTMVFAIIGLILLMVSFPFVAIIVNFIYSFSG